MKRLNLSEIKKIELRILLQFDAYCKHHGLKYYLSYGTLLGAVRHKGFIPWDDDVDVCMPRTDYERFLSEVNNKMISPFLEVCEPRFKNLDVPFCKIFAKNTAVVTKYVTDQANSRLWIDVFPIDGLPKDIAMGKQIARKCKFYRTMLGLCSANLGQGTTGFRKWSKYCLKPLAKMYGKNALINKLNKIGKQQSYETSNYVGNIVWGVYGSRDRMLKSEFEKCVEVEFEGYKFPTFSCWDSYLCSLYGHYMQLPPIDKRKTHNMEAYLLDVNAM